MQRLIESVLFPTICGHFLGAMNLTVICAFDCRVGYFNPQIRESIVRVEGLTYLPLWQNITNYSAWNKIMKQLAFLIISSTPSWNILHKLQVTLSGGANSFSLFPYIYLRCCVFPFVIIFGCHDLADLSAFVCRIGYFGAQIRRFQITNRCFDLLPTLRKCNYLFM
jgi:hypothetical protein